MMMIREITVAIREIMVAIPGIMGITLVEEITLMEGIILAEEATRVEGIMLVVETMLHIRIMLWRVRQSQWKERLPRRPRLEVC